MSASDLSASFKQICDEIKVALQKGERTDSPTLIAVSKTQPVESIQALYDLGQRDFGENYVQELVGKAEHFLNSGVLDIRWHFIGHLQTNKVKQLLPLISSIHSVDSLRLAEEISKRWRAFEELTVLPVFLAVNIDSEESKEGLSVDEVPFVCEKVAALDGLSLEGLMCIPAPGRSAGAFPRLRELESRCRPFTHCKLSMGMSDDFSLAIAEGSTHIRVGTRLFGKR